MYAVCYICMPLYRRAITLYRCEWDVKTSRYCTCSSREIDVPGCATSSQNKLWRHIRQYNVSLSGAMLTLSITTGSTIYSTVVRGSELIWLLLVLPIWVHNFLTPKCHRVMVIQWGHNGILRLLRVSWFDFYFYRPTFFGMENLVEISSVFFSEEKFVFSIVVPKSMWHDM